MKTTILFILSLLLMSCASVENIPKLNRDTSINRNQISQARQDIERDYPLTHAQYVTVNKQTKEDSPPARNKLANEFEKLTEIYKEFNERSQRFLTSVAQQQKSWVGKRRISSEDPEWEPLKRFKDYSKTEVKELTSLYKKYKSYKNSFNKILKNKDLIPYTKQLPRNYWQARRVLQEFEREENYENYNKEILRDLSILVRDAQTDFESLARLAQYLKQSEKSRRKYGRFPQGVSGPSQETEQKVAEMISSVINPNIVVAAINYAPSQNSLSDVAANLSPVRRSRFSDLVQYTSLESLKMVEDIFTQRKTEILEEAILRNRRDMNQILVDKKSATNKLRDLVSLRNQVGNTYRKVINEPIVKSFLSELQKQRANLLDALEPQLIAQISSTESLSNMENPLSGLIAQEDQKIPVVRRIQQALKKKLEYLTAFRPVRNASQLSIGSFTAKGLNYESELMAIYLGDFSHARLEPRSTVTSALLSKYLYAYGQHCDAYLPINKVPITESVCSAEEVTRNGYGVEVSRSCVRWVEKPTGLYADPVLYSVNNRLARKAGIDMVGNLFSGDPFASRAIADDILSIGNDMNKLVSKNKCSNAGLKRFEGNLYRFVKGQSPLLLPGKEKLSSIRNIRQVNLNTNNLNLKSLLNDLITENSKAWMMNRYHSGSVSGISIQSRSQDGSPKTVRARYRFGTLGQNYWGDVTLTFAGGIPQCLYYSDAPQTCRHPARIVINKYERGRYSK